MREIKFRALNALGNWNFGLLCHDKAKDKEFEWFISNSAGKPYAFGAVEKTIGQFIEKSDKNGTFIYEGDIILHKGAKGFVFYEKETAMFMVEFPLLRCIYSFDSIEGEIEIIGNIHQNPNLLDPR